MDLDMEMISFGYNEKVQVFRDIDIHIKSGTASVIYGESGAGKSTLFKLMIGRLTPSSGRIRWVKNNGEVYTPGGREGKIGLVYQKNEFINELTMEENLLIQFAYSNTIENLEGLREIIHKCSKELSITHLLDKYPSSLSIGEQRRFMVIRSLIYHPEVIILDEPTASLDYRNRVKTIELLSTANWSPAPTLIIFTHDMLFLNYQESYRFYKIADKSIEVINMKSFLHKQK